MGAVHESGPYRAYPYEAYIVRVVRALGVAGAGVSSWQTDTRTRAHGDHLGAELCWRRATLVERGAAAGGGRDLHLFWNPEDGWTYRWGPGRDDTGARALDLDAFASPSDVVALLGDLAAGAPEGTTEATGTTDATGGTETTGTTGAAAGTEATGTTAGTDGPDVSGAAAGREPRPAPAAGTVFAAGPGMNIGNGVVIGSPAQPVPNRRDLLGGPLDGHRLDVSTLTAEQLRAGLALRAGGCAYPGGRSVYTQDPERPDVLRWAGDIPR
ncbi:DUF6292 family protein [Kitasatospora sp. NPDC054939]